MKAAKSYTTLDQFDKVNNVEDFGYMPSARTNTIIVDKKGKYYYVDFETLRAICTTDLANEPVQ